MVFPWIPFLFGRRKRLSDIEYLSIKEFDGKLRKNESNKTTTGDLATLTATSGKDMYIARAKCNFYAETLSNATGNGVVELKINGVVVETARFAYGVDTSQSGGTFAKDYEFKNVGHKVAATQIIKLEVTVLDVDVAVEGFIECFEEATAESPQIG